MAKQKNNSEIAKRNRANRQRGGAFEKKVGDYLDMDVVPYSGSNARFGYGDVRDSIWLVECKNIKIEDNHCVIKEEWFDKNSDRALVGDRMPALAWMPTGKPSKYIILEYNEFIRLSSNVDIKREDKIHVIKKKSHNTKNLILDLNGEYFNRLKHVDVSRILLDGCDVNKMKFIMTLEKFKELIINANLKGYRTLEV